MNCDIMQGNHSFGSKFLHLKSKNIYEMKRAKHFDWLSMGDEEARGIKSGTALRLPLQITGIVETLIQTGKRSGGMPSESVAKDIVSIWHI